MSNSKNTTSRIGGGGISFKGCTASELAELLPMERLPKPITNPSLLNKYFPIGSNGISWYSSIYASPPEHITNKITVSGRMMQMFDIDGTLLETKKSSTSSSVISFTRCVHGPWDNIKPNLEELNLPLEWYSVIAVGESVRMCGEYGILYKDGKFHHLDDNPYTVHSLAENGLDFTVKNSMDRNFYLHNSSNFGQPRFYWANDKLFLIERVRTNNTYFARCTEDFKNFPLLEGIPVAANLSNTGMNVQHCEGMYWSFIPSDFGSKVSKAIDVYTSTDSIHWGLKSTISFTPRNRVTHWLPTSKLTSIDNVLFTGFVVSDVENCDTLCTSHDKGTTWVANKITLPVIEGSTTLTVRWSEFRKIDTSIVAYGQLHCSIGSTKTYHGVFTVSVDNGLTWSSAQRIGNWTNEAIKCAQGLTIIDCESGFLYPNTLTMKSYFSPDGTTWDQSTEQVLDAKYTNIDFTLPERSNLYMYYNRTRNSSYGSDIRIYGRCKKEIPRFIRGKLLFSNGQETEWSDLVPITVDELFVEAIA